MISFVGQLVVAWVSYLIVIILGVHKTLNNMLVHSSCDMSYEMFERRSTSSETRRAERWFQYTVKLSKDAKQGQEPVAYSLSQRSFTTDLTLDNVSLGCMLTSHPTSLLICTGLPLVIRSI